jgi:hypothetical protein
VIPDVQLREASLSDYEQIAALECKQNLHSRSREDWTRLWTENPLYKKLGSRWPIGWVLENEDGRIVGTLGNIPVPYVFRGRDLVVAAGRAWAVDERYRSVALMLMDTYFSQTEVDVFLNTTVNALAAEAFGVFGSRPLPAGDWTAASYWVTGYTGFARTALTVKKLPAAGVLCYPVGACLSVKDMLVSKRLPRTTGIEVQQASAFCARFEAFWRKLAAEKAVFLGVRTREVLDWHFGAMLERGNAWLFTVSASDDLIAYAVFQHRDEASIGLRRMRLVDFQSLTKAEECLAAILSKALALARRSGIHVVEKIGLNVKGTELIDACAPYRRKLNAWPSYYHVPDAALSSELESPSAWEPSSFDGDASL